MSSNLSLLPYKYNVTYNSSALTIPAFPGAYIYNAGIDTSPTALPVPIYCSEPVANTFMFYRDYMLLVLPGFKVDIYADVNFGTFKYSVDNTDGTDLKFFANKTGSYTMSSYKLFYSFPMLGTQELTMNMIPTSLVVSGNAVVSSPVTYNNTSYTLYSYKTTGSSTFRYTGPTDVTAELLVVAGGGAGGYSAFYEGSGGGGAGGVAIGQLYISKNVTYTCSVGIGAQATNTQAVFNGGDSTITNQSSQTLTVKGGGGGATGLDGNTMGGQNGGSGGGSTAAWAKQSLTGTKQDGTNNLPGTTVTFFGNNGGRSTGSWGSNVAGGGGGGGAGAVGQTGSPGNGGDGRQWTINGAYYGGGGAGGAGTAHNYLATGGTGGGGNGGVHGTDNTGGGGGGQRSGVYGRGNGGSGIIIIAVKTMDVYKLTL